MIGLEEQLHAALPHLSFRTRGILDALLLDGGVAGTATRVAKLVGLPSRFALARLLRHDGLPPLHKLADWVALLESATRGRVEIPAYVALDYLVQELRAPIPATVLERLTAATMTVAPVERDVALLAARSRGGLRLRALLGGSATSRVKLTSLRWLLLPSPGYLQWAYGRPRLGILPLIYLERIARYFARRVRWRLDAARQRTGRSL